MAYQSSARRRVPSRKSTPSQDPPSGTASSRVNTPDLFSSTTEDIPKHQHSIKPKAPTSIPKPPTPKPRRLVPPVSDSALSSSHAARQKGSEAFKVGDYTLALTHYTSALIPLPQTHPQRIIILSNRSLTNLKLGDSKAAIVDCDDLLSLVGPSRGEGEVISDKDGPKELKDLWGKGVMRKATGLESQEKYKEALEMWKIAVDAGIGGSQSLEGRRRCEKAIAPKPKPKQVTRTATPVRTSRTHPASSSATEELAKYNAAAAADEDEKTRLYDSVDSKITAWQGGKESNLRALLSSLDGILWPEAGWKKVNMAELVVANKVKIIYMKAIAKVHPDKVHSHPQTLLWVGLIADSDDCDHGAEDDCCGCICKIEWCMDGVQRSK
jgi:hypothetical protein